MKTQHQKALEAYTKCSQWLAKANELREAGKDDRKAMERSQYWLDRYNKLTGNA